MILFEVAIFAEPQRIIWPATVLTRGAGLLAPSSVIAVATHTFAVVGLVRVGAVCHELVLFDAFALQGEAWWRGCRQSEDTCGA